MPRTTIIALAAVVVVVGVAIAFFVTTNMGKTTSETVTKTVTSSGQVPTETVTKTTTHVSYTTQPSGTMPTSHSETTTTPFRKGEMSFELNCEKGSTVEAVQVYKKTGDYCWGWLKTQTYDIGGEKELEYAVVYVKLGPSDSLDSSGGLVDIVLSSDGEHWEKVKEINIVGGGPITVIAVKGDDKPFRYIRIAASDETPGHYIDYSAIDLAVGD